MIPKIEIEKIEKRIPWLRKWIYHPLTEIELSIAETGEHRNYSELENPTFRPITPGQTWGGEWKSAWFRGEYEIDGEYRGQKLLLAVDPGGESLVYIDGREVGAIDRQHKELPLTGKELKPGRHELMIDAYSGHHIPSRDPVPGELKSKDWELPTFKHCRLVCRNEVVWRLYYDMAALYMTARELPDESMRRHHILKALGEAVDMITWETRNTQQRNEDFKEALVFLGPVMSKKNGDTTPLLSLIGHAHIDIAWLWPLAETIRKCGRTFATQLKLMKEYPEFKFIQSQAQAYEYTEKHYPEVFEGICDAVAAGQWEVEGGMWVESDTNVPSAESLIRQFLLGKMYFSEKFDVDSKVLWLPDVFGYSGNLPQILKGCGIEYFVTSKIGWNDTNRFPYDLFRWQGIDGSEVLAHYIKNTYNAMTDPQSVWNTWRAFNQKELTDRMIHSVGYGDGGGGITMEHLEFARRLEDLEGSPKVSFDFVGNLMSTLNKNREEYPIWRGELYLELHRGTLTSQAWTKRNNRKCENLFRETELFSALAYLKGKKYPHRDLNEAWKKLLTNQFHDILPGSSIKEVYEDCDEIYGEIGAELSGLLKEARAGVEADFCGCKDQVGDQQDAGGILLWNTLNWDRSDLVSIPLKGSEAATEKIGDFTLDLPELPLSPEKEGIVLKDQEQKQVPVQIVEDRLVFDPRSVPGMGWKYFTWSSGDTQEAESGVRVEDQVIENEYLRLKLNASGELEEVYDKEADREVLPKGEQGNTIILAEDLPLAHDAWDIDHYYRQAEIKVPAACDIQVVASGPLEARVRITRKIGESSQLTQDLVLRKESRRVDFETTVDWQEKHRILKVGFPVDVVADRAIYEIQGGYIERSTHENTSWDQAQFEVCGHKWAALSEQGYGAAVLNDCKYGYETLGQEIRLTLLKSAAGPDPKADEGNHRFVYSFLPFTGDLEEARVPQQSFELNLPYLKTLGRPVEGDCQGGQFLKVFGDPVYLQSVKKSEDEEALILRLNELAGKRAQVRLEFPRVLASISSTNMLEKKEEVLAQDVDRITLDFKPFEIKTLKIPVGE